MKIKYTDGLKYWWPITGGLQTQIICRGLTHAAPYASTPLKGRGGEVDSLPKGLI